MPETPTSTSASPSTSTSPSSPSVTIVLHEDKQCKGSVRYGTKDSESPMSSIYLNRSFTERMPKSIEVTIRGR